MAKVTRRELAAALSASAVLLAQPPGSTTPPLPANPAEELDAARTALRQAAQQLAQFALPTNAEPAVHFQA